MRLAFSTNAFRRYTLAEAIRGLAGLGYQGVEIMADVPHAFPPDLSLAARRDLARLLADCGLAVANINAFMLHALGDTYHPSWIDPDPARRRLRIEHTRACLQLAADLGAATISTEPGGPSGALPEAAALDLFREGLLELAADARRLGVRILIEPEPGLVIETSAQYQAFVQDLDPAVFGLNFDLGHFFCVGEDPATLVRSFGDQLAHVHLEDIAADRRHHHLAPGAGAIDLAGVLDALREVGYAGFVTVELYPYEERPLAVAAEALAFLSTWQAGGTRPLAPV
ncbi:MAG: sugar phosphate isomerase/epimerase family protein [Thermodesulfobacteriota bacterium]